MIIQERDKFPKCLQPFKEVKAICIGICIQDAVRLCKTDWGEVQLAHAHILDDPFSGYICLQKHMFLNHKNLLLHEAAHILSNSAHDQKFRDTLKSIGGTLHSTVFYYKKRSTNRLWEIYEYPMHAYLDKPINTVLTELIKAYHPFSLSSFVGAVFGLNVDA